MRTTKQARQRQLYDHHRPNSRHVLFRGKEQRVFEVKHNMRAMNLGEETSIAWHIPGRIFGAPPTSLVALGWQYLREVEDVE